MRLLLTFVLCLLSLTRVLAASGNENDVTATKDLLISVRDKIKDEYYDPAFKGIEFDKIFAEAEQRIGSAKTVSEGLAIVAQAVLNLGDSHTVFAAPPHQVQIKYNWALRIVGQNVYVAAVKPGSDAEKQGVKAGERVLSIDGMQANRETLWMIHYLVVALNPRAGLHVRLQAADGSQREVAFASEVKVNPKNLTANSAAYLQKQLEEEKAAASLRSSFKELSNEVLYWKFSTFMDEADLESSLSKAKRYNAVLLDLRGNRGGRETALQDMLGAFLGGGREIAQNKTRLKTEALQTTGKQTVKGKLFVLIDGQSASAAEITARFIQLEGRGTILGDRSAGAVNGALFFVTRTGTVDRAVPYGANITVQQLIMKDGQPLEKIGVTPDVWLVPSPKDLAVGNDPVLAAAAKMAGVTLSKEEAGKISVEARPDIYD